MKIEVRLISAWVVAAIYYAVAMTGIVLRFDGPKVVVLALLQLLWAAAIGGIIYWFIGKARTWLRK